MVTIASRKSWGARYSDGDKALSGLAAEVFVHHSVTTQLPATATVAQERAQMRAIEAIGKGRGFPGISYNVIVFPSGRAYQGVSFHRRGTHTGGRNSTTRSICFAGNYETHKPTAAQLATAAAIFAYGKGRWWSKSAPLRGHRNVKSTACPGRHVYSRLDSIRAGSGVSASKPAGSTSTGKLDVDGRWGSDTTSALQRRFGTPVDGVVSRQNAAIKPKNPSLTTGWEWVVSGTQPEGSAVIKALQGKLGVTKDGKLGPKTITALQKYLGTATDGTLSKNPSPTIQALQRRLNQGKL